MNLLNFLGEITTYSDFSLIGLVDVVHLTCPPHEIVTSEPASDVSAIRSGIQASTPTPLQTPELYRLLYIHSGRILYRLNNETTALPSGSLLFLKNTDEVRFRVSDSPLDAWVFYLCGNALHYYKEASTRAYYCLSADSPFPDNVHRLIQMKKSTSSDEELLVNGHVTTLLSAYLLEDDFEDKLQPVTPAYLLSVKEEFDRNYSAEYSLDVLSANYKVSKYRLCREFAQHFGISPIKYLNRVRLQNARLLLVSTDLHVGEIAGSVGIENVNHFIKLFKAETGMTPLEYRQKLQA